MLRWNKIYLKRFGIGPYEIAAFFIIILAVLLRIILIAKGWPQTDSDEGTMGLEAIHIAFRGEHPTFLYGQNYMGTLEAYVGALLFRLFGVSLFALRSGMVILFALFLVSLYLLTSLLYTKKLALVSLAPLSVGALNILIPELRAVGGAVETLLFGTILLLLASWLALTADQDQLPRRRSRRLIAYGGWGLSAGLGLWSHLLVCPFILMGGLILVLFCWREARTWAPFCLLVGLILGALPLIYYNATAPWTQNSLTTALQIHSGSTTGTLISKVTFEKQIVGTFFYSLPIATGLNPLCSLQGLPLFGPQSSRAVLCTIVQGSWSVGYISLLMFGILLALIPLWKLWKLQRAQAQAWTFEERQAAVLHFARLMLLCSAGLTLVLFALSPLAAEKPWSTRYLIGLLIATPAVIWPLWKGIGTTMAGRWNNLRGAGYGISWLSFAILLLIGATFLGGTISNFSDIGGGEKLNQQDARLTRDLLQIGARHIYSGYWVCDRLTFASQEQIICSVVDLQLKAGLNRYSPYHTIVAADAGAAYVFPVGSDFALAAVHNPTLSSGHYHLLILDGYMIYQPERSPVESLKVILPPLLLGYSYGSMHLAR